MTTKPFSFRLDPAVVAEIDSEAKRLGITRTEWVARAVGHQLGSRSRDPITRSAPPPSPSNAGWQGPQRRPSEVEPRFKGGK